MAAANGALKLPRLPTDTTCMAAAPDTGVRASELDTVSPELVLVDPRLAASARALLPDPAETLARPDRSARVRRRVFPVSFPDDGLSSFEADATSAEARERLMDGAVDSEVMGSLAPSGRHFRRPTTLIPTSSAASAVALFVLQLYMGHGALG
jgi:hypothetical protein